MLKLNQQTVRNWIDQGRLPALRVGRRVRIRRSDLDRVLEESSIAVAGAQPRSDGPSADDFWGGEPIGALEPGITASSPASQVAPETSVDIAANGAANPS